MGELQGKGNCSLSISWVGAFNGDMLDDPLQVELADRLQLKPSNLFPPSIGLITASVILVTAAALAIAMVANKFYVSSLW